MAERRREGTPDRREMIRETVRYGLVGGLALLAGDLLCRGAAATGDCARPGACGACPEVSRCRLEAIARDER